MLLSKLHSLFGARGERSRSRHNFYYHKLYRGNKCQHIKATLKATDNSLNAINTNYSDKGLNVVILEAI